MSVISAFNLSKSFDPVDIFSSVTFSIPKGGRTAIVGPNGIGKTTLLRILVGIDVPSSGTVQRARDLRIGYLPQEALLSTILEDLPISSENAPTVWEECLKPFDDLITQETELRNLERLMSDPAKANGILEQYGRLQREFEHAGGYSYELRIRQVLTGLGFDPGARNLGGNPQGDRLHGDRLQGDRLHGDFHRPVTQLSGGQRTRLVLARLLLTNPDLLVLDEPTNHLDIQAVEWLEGYLREWEGAALIVSHDRYFLDRVVDHILEMRAGGMETYRGNYTHYLQQREQRWDLRKQIYEKEMERLLKELDYIKRNISGQNVSQARGRLRRLSRQVEAIEQLGFETVTRKNWMEVSSQADISEHMMGVEEVEQRLKSLRGPTNRPLHLHLNIKASSRSGDLVLRTRDLAIGYPDEGRPLFTSPDLLLKRGECAAVIGPNGAGKTTFLKTLLGELLPLQGEVILGASLHIGFFAQAHEGLKPQHTLVEEIESLEPKMLLADIRNYLARYLFTGEDVFRQVSTLSGGERGRLALAMLELSKANLLLLDEPTNHLDIPSQEILQEVLANYGGTILLVSHDRYLIDALATQVWEIDPDQASLSVFDGTYSEYREFQEAQKIQAQKAAEEKRKASAPQKASVSRISSQDRRKKARLKEVEGLITTLEAQLDELSRRLENPPADAAKVQKWGNEYVRLQRDLEELFQEWEDLVESSAV
jgi:ATP-binding cassette, subfamily F, member 3